MIPAGLWRLPQSVRHGLSGIVNRSQTLADTTLDSGSFKHFQTFAASATVLVYAARSVVIHLPYGLISDQIYLERHIPRNYCGCAF